MNSSERPKVGTAVIVRKDGKILLGKRKGSHAAGTWAFPGGHLEFGESFEDCIARETQEETGIQISNIRPATFTNDVFAKEQKHYVTLFFVADHKSGDPKIMEPDKCDDWKWFAWDSLPQPLMLPIENLLKQNFDPFKIS